MIVLAAVLLWSAATIVAGRRAGWGAVLVATAVLPLVLLFGFLLNIHVMMVECMEDHSCP